MSLDRSLVRYALMGLLVYQGAVASTLALVVPFLSLSLAQTLMGAMAVALCFGCVRSFDSTRSSAGYTTCSRARL